MYDCVIVGAGPAGSTLAYKLGKKKYNVLLLEKEKLPRNKICAGAIPKRIFSLLNFDLKEVIEDEITSAIITYKLMKPVIVKSELPFVYTVNRSKFDYLLTQKAMETGILVKTEEKVEKIEEFSDKIVIFTDRSTYETKFLVGADGVESKVARLAGFSLSKRYVLTREAEVFNASFIPQYQNKMKLDFGLVPYGYAWLFPKKDRLSIGVGGFYRTLSNPEIYFEKWLSHCLPGYNCENMEVFNYPISLAGKREIVTKGRIALIGEAAHFVSPLTGEGIYYAVKSGELASQAIISALENNCSNLSNYQRLVENFLYPHFNKVNYASMFFYTFPRFFHFFLALKKENLIKYCL